MRSYHNLQYYIQILYYYYMAIITDSIHLLLIWWSFIQKTKYVEVLSVNMYILYMHSLDTLLVQLFKGGRKVIWTLNVVELLLPDRLLWVFQKLQIYWDFSTIISKVYKKRDSENFTWSNDSWFLLEHCEHYSLPVYSRGPRPSLSDHSVSLLWNRAQIISDVFH